MTLVPFPKPIPTTAETVNILAKAMGFRMPEGNVRFLAGAHPVREEEHHALVEAYSSIRDMKVRQAVLDTVVAVKAAQG